MIICDICQNTDIRKYKPFEYHVICVKQEEKNKRTVGREVIKIEMHLCEKCISEFNNRLGNFIHQLRINESVDVPANLDRPVGVSEHTKLGGTHV